MAQVSVAKRKFTNDQGNEIDYNVIVITGVLNGREESFEKSLSRTEAMLVGMLLDSDEGIPVASSRKATDGEKVEVKRKKNAGLDLFSDD